MENIYTYVSTRACYDPVKTIFVFPPSEDAKNCQLAGQFAERSGWRTLTEYDGAVLIIPAAPNGWNTESPDLPGRLFNALRNSFSSRNGNSLLGRDGKLWCWETMIYIAGDGADFAGDCVVADPGLFAAAALVNGGPRNFEAGKRPSRHWLVKQVSQDYSVKNNQIPSCIWLLGTGTAEGQESPVQQSLEYFTTVNSLGQPESVSPESISLEGILTLRRANPESPPGTVRSGCRTLPETGKLCPLCSLRTVNFPAGSMWGTTTQSRRRRISRSSWPSS